MTRTLSSLAGIACAMPAAGARPMAAGLCMPGQQERDADTFLTALARDLAAADADTSILMTHFVAVGERRVVGASVTFARVTDAGAAAWSVLREAVGPVGAVCLGRREHGPDELLVGAGAASIAAEYRHSGRAVVFPGCAGLVGTLTAAHVMRTSAVQRITVVGRREADPDELIDTRDFVRPLLQCGVLVLPTRQAVGDVLIPAEVPNPTPCCAEHG